MPCRIGNATLCCVVALLGACSTNPSEGTTSEDTDGSEDGSSESGSGESLDRADAPRASAEARCEVAANCACGTRALRDEACIAEEEQRLALLLEDAETEGLSYDPECGAELIPLAWNGCQTLPESLLQDPQYEDLAADFPVCGACTTFLYGDVGLGEPCGNDSVSVLACDQGLSCRRGRCTDPCEQASVGEECDEIFCEPGLRCELSGSKLWTCAEPSSGGCGEGEACGPNEFCDVVATFSCVARLAVGEACISDECVADAFCDQATGICAARQADGSSCSAKEQCTADWCDDGQCGTGAPLACVFE